MDFGALDDETLRLATQLQLDDVRSQLSSSKGKYPANSPPDAELALRSYGAELESLLSCISDKRMAVSITEAVNISINTINAIVEDEDQARQDRILALRLSERTPPEAPESTNSFHASSEADAITNTLQLLQLQGPEEETISSQAESSSLAARRVPTTARQQRRDCVGCGDKLPVTSIVQCPCSHEYCRECLEGLFRASLSDESLFPPRCCTQPIEFSETRMFLSQKLIAEFEDKRHELETNNRTYCCLKTCSVFIRIEHIKEDRATCHRCWTVTCAICKQQAHNGDCPRDPAIQQVLAIAAENGWQRCFKCSRVVELEHGCNHMTCRCGAQFCYVCGLKWKTCGCDQWSESRLLARANAIVDRDGVVNQRERNDLVRRARVNLVENHECEHTNWRCRRGRFRCEECRNTLPDYIFECRRCQLMACRRCRYNRL